MMKTGFNPLARLLHWLMAAMILAMLFIGVGMVSSVSARHAVLIAIHKPLGIAILVLVIVRLVVRFSKRPPALPEDLPGWQRAAAHLSHWVLYALMIAMPLIGWAMLSAGGYPVMLGGGVQLPALMGADPIAFAWLRNAHELLAFVLFATVVLHLAAALFHGLIRRDGVFGSMARGR
ncbi:cytochrome b [Burkholderia gladioli]|jgi:cytochrome b561|uniref:Cytochrome b n=3 Tax=Burkholderia TaxID=32008 RepID=A0A095W5H4_BURGA|nr:MULTISPECIES: cytochrome b [Burkholderia]AEA58721.1 Cytochrome B561 [Burkholderia gladioli BSR3]AJW98010.1 prokaryotic cytochrome b561 family protein [Burkholderia gladioli]ASD77559.1 cytochrome b [Burkholderia gladioli pv. gladioli]ATF85990.1 cytochrome b [Burkholderia gladioli pv. gladioli]AWY53525.1 cytochrome b [Burkholderia gladioli pv. gladioli]